MHGSPVVLDLDGVIVKSNFVKHDAMLSLFDAYPEKHHQISSYILANGGVRRDLKLRHILKNIIDVPLAEDSLSSCLSKYARRLENLLAGAPMVEGVATFLADREQSFCFYVSSSAPEAEVQNQLSRRGLLDLPVIKLSDFTSMPAVLTAMSAAQSRAST
jgi:beta-phosphoglucomutase-like phosphatase (HAD superfamily)